MLRKAKDKAAKKPVEAKAEVKAKPSVRQRVVSCPNCGTELKAPMERADLACSYCGGRWIA